MALMEQQDRPCEHGAASGFDIQLALTDKEKVCSVMRRCRKMGGVPIKEAQVQQFQAWFRTLSRRGFLDSSFLKDAEKVKATFREQFPNGMTRGQYSRSVLTFFSGLDDEQFPRYFPNITREETVDVLLSIGAEGSRDHQKHLANKRQQERGAFQATS